MKSHFTSLSFAFTIAISSSSILLTDSADAGWFSRKTPAAAPAAAEEEAASVAPVVREGAAGDAVLAKPGAAQAGAGGQGGAPRQNAPTLKCHASGNPIISPMGIGGPHANAAAYCPVYCQCGLAGPVPLEETDKHVAMNWCHQRLEQAVNEEENNGVICGGIEIKHLNCGAFPFQLAPQLDAIAQKYQKKCDEMTAARAGVR